jgi:hypothetical protein
MLWDESADDLILGGAAGLSVNSTALVTGVLTTTAATVFNGGFTANADSTLGTDKKVQFRDAAIYINSSVDGQLDIVADTEIQIAATTIDVNGALDVSGTALVTGVLTTTAATVFNGGFAAGGVGTFADGSNSAPSLTNTGDLNTGLYFPAADEVGLTVGGTQRLNVSATGIDVTGAVVAAAGTALLPSITTTGDLNTGMWFPAADTIAFSEFGIEVLRIDAAGNVGIGTTSASEKLTVNGSINLPTVNTWVRGAGHAVLQVDATKTYFYGGTGGVQFRTADNASALVDITNAGNVNIADGNLIVAAGHGIDFSAQTATSASGASATSELFDHYEEGTWTPTLSNFTVTGATTVNGRYTRIGRQVTVQGSVSAATSIAYGTSCLIGGFPFAGVYYVSEAISKTAGVIVGGQHADLPSSNHSGACFTDSANLRLFVGNFTTTAANENIYFTATYFVA